MHCSNSQFSSVQYLYLYLKQHVLRIIKKKHGVENEEGSNVLIFRKLFNELIQLQYKRKQVFLRIIM